MERPGPELFRRNFLEPKVPVIIRGLMDGWPAFQQWNPEYLDRSLVDGEIMIFSTDRPDYYAVPRRGVMSRIASTRPGAPAVYIGNANILDSASRPAMRNQGKDAYALGVRELRKDVVVPDIVPAGAVVR